MQMGQYVERVRSVLSELRPDHPSDISQAEANLRELIDRLQGDGAARDELAEALARGLSEVRLAHALCEQGVLPDRGFLEELQRRVGQKVLPSLHERDDLRVVIHELFDGSRDLEWVSGVDRELWTELISLLLPDELEHPHHEVRAAIIGLAQRIGKGLTLAD